MNRDQNLARKEIAEFFKQHPDAPAFFIAAGFRLEDVRLAILGITVENIQPGDKKGYVNIIDRVVAQRAYEVTRVRRDVEVGLGLSESTSTVSVDLPPPVMTLRQLDPKTSGIPWWSGEEILVRLVDPQRMITRIEEIQRLPSDQGGGAGGGLLKMLPTIGRHRELLRVTVKQLEKVNALRIRFPHCSAVIDRVQSALHARAVAGWWARIPPILLKSVPGTGKKNFSRFIIRIAIVAVALSVAVMIAASALIAGFKNEISRKIFEFWGQIHITDTAYSLSFEPQPIEKN